MDLPFPSHALDISALPPGANASFSGRGLRRQMSCDKACGRAQAPRRRLQTCGNPNVQGQIRALRQQLLPPVQTNKLDGNFQEQNSRSSTVAQWPSSQFLAVLGRGYARWLAGTPRRTLRASHGLWVRRVSSFGPKKDHGSPLVTRRRCPIYHPSRW